MYVEDLGSTNGTLINGATTDRPTALSVTITRTSCRVSGRMACEVSIHASMPSLDCNSARGGRSSTATTGVVEVRSRFR